MTRSSLPPRPPIRAPEPPDGAACDPESTQLYGEAKRLHDEGRFAEALKVYEKLATMNPADGRLSILIGNLYFWGTGTASNATRAEQWLERAAWSGEHRAYLSLAGISASQGRPDRERAWLEEAGERDYAPALYYLGSAWEFGRWGQVDKAKAIQYYERAAARGYCHATLRISVRLLRGDRGLLRIPLGLVMYITSFLRLVSQLYRNPYDERVIW